MNELTINETINKTIRDCIKELKSISPYAVSNHAQDSINCVLDDLNSLLPDTSPQEQKT